MSRQEDFDVAAKNVASTKRTADAQAQCEYDFALGCEHGYQYAVEKVCKWLSKNAKKYVCMICDSGVTSVTYEDENLINDIRKAMQ